MHTFYINRFPGRLLDFLFRSGWHENDGHLFPDGMALELRNNADKKCFSDLLHYFPGVHLQYTWGAGISGVFTQHGIDSFTHAF